MLQLITSYLFEGEPKHLNSFYYRTADKTEQFWTLPHIPGRRIPNADVFVLTSKYTFSAAEEFTYNLQNLKRATIIGETTGGGAHPGDGYTVDEGFVMFIPNGRAVNPISQTNWEGTGVSPDIAVPEQDSLYTAHVEALRRLIERTADAHDKHLLSWDLETVKAEYHPASVDSELLERCAGEYGEDVFEAVNGSLRHYHKRFQRCTVLYPMENGQFALGDQARVQFELPAEGQATSQTSFNRNGNRFTVRRSK